jgi:uncharacterized protein with von Willebrand factor type A (vWA) domain
MRPTTVVWAKFESKGFPDKTEIVQGTIVEITRHWAKWITREGVYMTHTINMTLAKHRVTLETGKKDMDMDQEQINALFEAAGVNMDSDEDQ